MTQQKKSTAAASKGAAARAEKKDEPRTVEFRGITLELPKKLPASVAFDMTELESGISVTGVIRLLGSMLGPEQLARVRQKITEDGDDFDGLEDILVGLLEDTFAAYGMTVGERPASATS